MINLDLGAAYIRSFKWSNSNLDQEQGDFLVKIKPTLFIVNNSLIGVLLWPSLHAFRINREAIFYP